MGVFSMCSGIYRWNPSLHTASTVREPTAIYSGYGRRHCLSTQVIIDVYRNIRFVKCGYLGHLNDAGQFLLMPIIGPNGAYFFPADCVLLGDRGYANRYPIMTPYRRNQMQRGNHAQVIYNQELASHRIYVEHVMHFIKTYAAVKIVHRHPRWMMPIVMEVSCFLGQRHVALVNELH